MDKSALYGDVLDALDLGIYYVDGDMKVQLWNKAVHDLTGFGIEDLEGKSCRGNLLCNIEKSSVPLCASGCPLKATNDDGVTREALAFIRNKDGVRVPVKVQTRPIYKGDRINGSIAVLHRSETANEGEIEGALTKLALTDKLTGLYNRAYYEGEVNVKLSQMAADGNQYVVLFLDIDNFSKFNNTYGHETGDAVLKEMAQAVTGVTRKTDAFCRWGGEEFVGLFQINTADSLSGLAITSVGNKVLKAIRDIRIPFNGEELCVTASIGLTSMRPSDTVEGVVKRADDLMYKSKTTGKNKFTIG